MLQCKNHPKEHGDTKPKLRMCLAGDEAQNEYERKEKIAEPVQSKLTLIIHSLTSFLVMKLVGGIPERNEKSYSGV